MGNVTQDDHCNLSGVKSMKKSLDQLQDLVLRLSIFRAYDTSLFCNIFSSLKFSLIISKEEGWPQTKALHEDRGDTTSILLGFSFKTLVTSQHF